MDSYLININSTVSETINQGTEQQATAESKYLTPRLRLFICRM